MDTRVTVFIILSALLVSFSSLISGENPTISECRPHIEATIRDMADKIVEGKEAIKADLPSPSTLPYEGQSNCASQVPQVSTNLPASEAPALETNEQEAHEPVVHEPIASEPEIMFVPSSEPSAAPQIVRKTSPPVYQQAAIKSEIGFINKIVYSMFDLTGTTERDSKFSTPWNTHPEFKKRDENLAKTTSTKVDYNKPGIISSFLNKWINVIFSIDPSLKRDPVKWTQPWQTHKENIKVKSPVVEKKPTGPKQSWLRLTFFNNFIEMVFGKFETKRDPKFAKPWNTHPEFQNLVAAKEAAKTKKATKVEGKPGVISKFLNDMVSFAFGISKEQVRDPKWSTPWQTHEEFKSMVSSKKSAKKEKELKVTAPYSPGIISRTLNSLVLLVFEDPKGVRDTKWAQPWNTHKEHVRAPKEVSSEEKAKPKPRQGFLGFTFVNSFVNAIFGESTTKRDPKWAEPWQTHSDSKSLGRVSRGTVQPAPTPRPAEVPAPKHVEVPVSKPVEVPVSKPVEVSAPKPVEVPDPKPIEVSAPKPVEVPVSKPVTVPAPKPVEVPFPEQVPEPKEQIFPSDTVDKPVVAKATDHPTYRVADAPNETVKQVLEEVATQKNERKEKIVEDEEQIVVIPSTIRQRDHIDSILGLDDASTNAAARTDPIADATLRDLKKIYETSIKPLEAIYKYQDISNRHLSDAEIFGTPLILFLGPYSTGKSTMINYLLGIEFTKRALKTGTPPSHGVFRIIQYGDYDRDLDGTDLSGHWSFGSLQKFGQNFVDQIKGKALNIPLLKKATFVEAPGILEMRRAGERLYPFNDVVQWFIDRADLILVMFDYTKLDAGYELEAILDQLKGRESQTRILLNKADQVPPEELIRVQGSLFWNLSPLLGIQTPPTVYAGSFASFPYRQGSPQKLFEAQEVALLHDLARALNSRVDNRVAIARRHAVRVRNHAQMVDTYLATFYKNKGFLTSNHKLAEEIVENPHAYNIYEGMSLLKNISRYDLPDAEVYRDFFRIHNLYNFQTLRESCTYIGGCPLDKIDATINKNLPELLTRHRRLVESASTTSKLPNPALRSSGMGAGAAQARANKL